MLICMKPTSKEITRLQAEIRNTLKIHPISFADISKISGVDPSQVGRICKGTFKTFSHNVVRVCNALDVTIPQIKPAVIEKELSKAHSSLLKIWDRTPEGAVKLRRMLDTIAQLHDGGPVEETTSSN